MKRTLIFWLLICALLTGTISCGASEAPSSDTTAAPQQTSVDTENDYGYVAPDIPAGTDYKGEEFCIAYPEWSNYNSYYWAESLNGDVVNDACYKRLMACEEQLNIDLTWFAYGYIDNMYAFVEKAVSAGLTDYDMVLTHNNNGCINLVETGLVMDWNTVPNIDWTKPYYDQTIIENFTVDGVLPFLSSDFQLPDLNGIFFNCEMVDSFNLENPYTIVKDGKWTMDKMAEMAAVVTTDLDGNNVFDENDRYGFAAENGWQMASYVTACGQPFVNVKDGTMRLALEAERSVNLHEKLHNFLYNTGDAFFWAYDAKYDPNRGDGAPPVNFADGRCLFYQAPLSYFPFMRSSEVDYGILPYPKLDEAQEDYYCLNWAGYMTVPKSVSDPGRVGHVVEVLSAESCRTVQPAFFEELLGNKIAREPDAVEVLDMMFDSLVCDNGIMMRAYSIANSVTAESTFNYASTLETKRTEWEENIKKYIPSDVFFESRDLF